MFARPPLQREDKASSLFCPPIFSPESTLQRPPSAPPSSAVFTSLFLEFVLTSALFVTDLSPFVVAVDALSLWFFGGI